MGYFLAELFANPSAEEAGDRADLGAIEALVLREAGTKRDD